jgi:hypothetical protein
MEISQWYACVFHAYHWIDEPRENRTRKGCEDSPHPAGAMAFA